MLELLQEERTLTVTEVEETLEQVAEINAKIADAQKRLD